MGLELHSPTSRELLEPGLSLSQGEVSHIHAEHSRGWISELTIGKYYPESCRSSFLLTHRPQFWQNVPKEVRKQPDTNS